MKRLKTYKLFEFEEKMNLPSAEKISFMDKLYQIIKDEIMPNIPSQYKADYSRGKEIKIHTGSKKDLIMGAKIEDDKMVVYAKPIDSPEYIFNYNFNSEGIKTIVNIIKSEFESSETGGINTSVKRDPIELDTRDLKSFDQEDEEDTEEIEKPIKKKQRKVKRTIDINIIKEVLEDAYILDDIDLKDISVNELIRRMLVETRKK